jgi:prephenate dehydrogenase
VDRVEPNVKKAVSEANLVILAVPLDQIRESLAVIAPFVPEACVVMDTGPVKEIAAAWAGELLPHGRHYIGLTPVMSASYLHEFDSGVEAAHADLFKGGLIAIVASHNADPGAIKMAADLTRLLGAEPLFADPLELDGLMAAAYLLPQLMAAGMLNATVDLPGWREARKIAGRAYAEASAPINQHDDVHGLAAAALLNRENTLRVLDSAIAALNAIRGDIDKNDGDALNERLSRARLGHDAWLKGRRNREWVQDGVQNLEIPPAQGILSKWFGVGGGRRSDRKNDPSR